MNLVRASQRAVTVRGRKSAARLYNDIEYELALGEPDNHLESVGEQALALLEERFPGVREAARDVEEPPSLSRRAGHALHSMHRADVPTWPARHPKHHIQQRVQRSTSRLNSRALAHPLATVATVTVSIIVIAHFWAYIALAVIALAALNASRGRQR
jgi:hypothetical protein